MVVGRGVVLAASYEARAFGIRAPWAGRRPAACARGSSPSTRGWRPTRTPARPSSMSSPGPRRSSKGSRSTRPSWTSVGCGGSRVNRWRSRGDSATRSGTRWGCRSPSASPAPSSWPRWPTVAKPDGLLHVPAGEELAFLHPLPVERLWASARSRPASCTIAASARSGGRRAARGGARLHPRPGGTSHPRFRPQPRSAAVETGRRRRSMGSQRALGRRGRPESELAAILDALCDRVTARLRKGERLARTIVLRLRFDDFARRARTRCLGRRRTPRRSG